MRWEEMRKSENIEDRTGMGPAGRGGGLPLGGGLKLGGGGLILLLVLSLLFGVNPLDMLDGGDATAPVPQPAQPGYGPQISPQPGRPGAAASTQKLMVGAVVGDTEDVWTSLFQVLGRPQYQKPTLVLFSGRVQSACGLASAAAGPFYCPADQKLYLDTAFFDELSRRFGAPGDFAQAYVIAHEVGHHVQNLLGTMRQVDRASVRGGASHGADSLAVRLELQADCYAGVWGYFAQKRNLLDAGDLEEGLRAAAAVGDDQIMKRTQGYVVPDAFTHGSAQQRARWFQQGLTTGDPRKCDTFGPAQP
jgi:predicted metalloprotease